MRLNRHYHNNMKRFTKAGRSFWAVLLLASFSSLAFADAFIPTMIEANVMWVFVLPLVVAVEGRMLVGRGWQDPYKVALKGNLLSMLAALPLGIFLSVIGGYFGTKSAGISLDFLPESVRFFLAQAFLYGHLPAPSYGFIDGFQESGIYLAALVFIGICWCATFVIEGRYYMRKNPSLPKRDVLRLTALMNVASYGILMALWFPYSVYSAASEQKHIIGICSHEGAWSSKCGMVWELFPETKNSRLVECRRGRISDEKCFRRK